MSVIDQAFVKAYSRRTHATSGGDTPPQITDAIASPPDVSINPKSEHSAIVWVDAVADQYLRRDEPHKQQPPTSRVRTTASTGQGMQAGGQGTYPKGETRARGSRPVAHPAAPTSPAGDAIPMSKPAEAAKETRVDAGQRASFTSKASVHSPGESSQMTAVPWIEASSTLVETPLHQSLTGPFYSETVIVQENYLPTPIATPPKTVGPGSQPAAPTKTEAHSPAPSRTTAPQAPFTQPVTPPFAAVWEVDAFEFTDTVIALFGDAGLIKSIGFPLDRAVSEGLQTLLITSIEQGAGRTTVATGIAIAAASAGLRVALIDATMATASAIASQDGSSLADALNLEIQYGWIEAVRSGISIAETAIHSIEDQLTVLPLVVPMAGLPPTADEFSRVVQTLRQSFDLVVIDGPPCTEAAFGPLISHHAGTPSIDAAILVQDMRETTADQANRVMEMLRRDGITGLGMVQNFV